MFWNHLVTGKRKALAGVLLAALLLAGCGASLQETQQPSEETAQTLVFPQPDPVTGLVQLESVLPCSEGVYALEAQPDGITSRLTYYDRATATSHVLCQREGCTHDTWDCPAVYHLGSISGLLCYEGCLYLLEPDITLQTPGFTLYRCDLDGGNKTVVLTHEDVKPKWENRNLSQVYYDGLSLYLTYLAYGTDLELDILKVSLTNNPKMDHDLLCYWYSEPEVKPVIRWFGPVVDGRILLRNSMEEYLLLDTDTWEIEPLLLSTEGWTLDTVWDRVGIFTQYSYDMNCWLFKQTDLFTGETLMEITAFGYDLEYAPASTGEMALLNDAYQYWLVDWDRGEISELPLVRWRGDDEITILPIAQSGEEYLLPVREELYSNFRITNTGSVDTNPVYVCQYAFISVEDYLAGQPNYRIIQAAE